MASVFVVYNIFNVQNFIGKDSILMNLAGSQDDFHQLKKVS